MTHCKQCVATSHKTWRFENWDENRKILKAVNDKNWRLNNPDKHNARVARRRAKKLNATPNWLTKKHHSDIGFLYWFAASIKGWHGKDYQVDHVHPLKGKNFSGLHVPWNLQILSQEENDVKGSKPPIEESHLFF